ncbi:unnamed protein product [Linum trigynum]|uniref:Uncharacterized protein n=1 Tax=Linum trigynum TaxID=586398 RepID=A0AAV2DM02_9ROSI
MMSKIVQFRGEMMIRPRIQNPLMRIKRLDRRGGQKSVWASRGLRWAGMSRLNSLGRGSMLINQWAGAVRFNMTFSSTVVTYQTTSGPRPKQPMGADREVLIQEPSKFLADRDRTAWLICSPRVPMPDRKVLIQEPSEFLADRDFECCHG